MQCVTVEQESVQPRLNLVRAAGFAPLLTALVAACVPIQTTTAPSGPPGQRSAASSARPPREREWAYLSRYREANAHLARPAPGEKRVVFLGDSITESWAANRGFFPGKPYVNRGIGGQTTAQLLVRFRQDVIGLEPALVVIMAGTNDIAENGGPTTLEAIEDNLRSMAELARLNGIRVVLASNLPAIDYPWRPGLQPAGKISALNRWIASYCAENHLVYLDYYSAMVGEDRALRPDLTSDGVHPTAAGFALMAPLAEKAIREALE
jgi:lysophospholipase L1-like esterase